MTTATSPQPGVGSTATPSSVTAAARTIRPWVSPSAGANVAGSNGVTGYQVVSGSSRVGNGAGGGAGADGVALETKWAYIDFAMPFNVPLRVRTGIQYWYLPKGLVTDDDYAGVRAYGSVAPISYEAAWFRANRGTTTTVAPSTGGAAAMNSSTKKDNAFDYYEVKFDAALSQADQSVRVLRLRGQPVELHRQHHRHLHGHRRVVRREQPHPAAALYRPGLHRAMPGRSRMTSTGCGLGPRAASRAPCTAP